MELMREIDKELEEMPCFNCNACFNDEQCYNKRHTQDETGIEGRGCPRIKKMLEGGI